MFQFGRITCFVAGAALVAGTAQAGTLLKLNAGRIDTTRWVQNFAAQKNDIATEYIVQFKKAITESDKKALAAKFEVFGYLPDDALVVRGTSTDLTQFHRDNAATVQAVVPYQAHFKVSPAFGSFSVFDTQNVQSVVVKTFKASESLSVARKIEALNSQVELQVVEGKSVCSVNNRSSIMPLPSSSIMLMVSVAVGLI